MPWWVARADSRVDKDRDRTVRTRVQTGLTKGFTIVLHTDRDTKEVTNLGDEAAVAAGK